MADRKQVLIDLEDARHNTTNSYYVLGYSARDRMYTAILPNIKIKLEHTNVDSLFESILNFILENRVEEEPGKYRLDEICK